MVGTGVHVIQGITTSTAPAMLAVVGSLPESDIAYDLRAAMAYKFIWILIVCKIAYATLRRFD